MSSVSLTTSKRIDSLTCLGYSRREAEFLCLAALHGGYFLRRQYWEFIGQESGSAAAALLEKLQGKKHVVARSALNQTKIYHLVSRTFFNAIGESDNRNRREHSPLSIKARLMTLDFVLGHPNPRYLATEREKLEYFSSVLGIPLQSLPFKRYVAVKGKSTTTRYFVDKYPVFLSERETSEPRSKASFCYVDQGATTRMGFDTYLDQYAGLFLELADFELIYVADRDLLFAPAAQRFRAFWRRSGEAGNGTSGEVAGRLLQYFEARALFENGQMDSFTREKLIRFRNDREEFSALRYQRLYEQWIKRGGARAALELIAPKVDSPVRPEPSFGTYLLGRSYDFF